VCGFEEQESLFNTEQLGARLQLSEIKDELIIEILVVTSLEDKELSDNESDNVFIFSKLLDIRVSPELSTACITILLVDLAYMLS
jgi:hypothetical protein